MQNVTIDQEFKALIPPLTEEEFHQLSDNITADGCRDPLVIWKGHNIILDGHNRHQICTEHNIPFKTTEIEHADRDSAKIWIIRNQFGRRNLTMYQRGELILKLEPLLRVKAKENQATSTGGSNPQLLQNSAKAEPIHTRDELSKAAGISHDTIDKVRKISEKAVEPMKELVRSGEISVNAAAAVAELPQEEQEEIVEQGPKAVQRRAKEVREKKKKTETVSEMTEEERMKDLERRGAGPFATEAMQLAFMAIAQLERIRSRDYKKLEAIDKVIDWCQKRKEFWQKGGQNGV